MSIKESHLTKDQHLHVYKLMISCRAIDKRVWMLNRQGKAAIVASAQGHESAQIASAFALEIGKDVFFTYYRDLGVLISLGLSFIDILQGFTAKSGEPMSGSRQFPTHGAIPDKKLINLSNVVGTQIPQAVSAALSAKIKGTNDIVIVYFGDGASSAGDCHEGMNFASIHKLPIIFFCENNGFAISVPLNQQMANDNVASRAQGYGFPGITIDGNDVNLVYETTKLAAKRARNGEGPTLIETKTNRFLPHTSDDDHSRYRNLDELSNKKDPIEIYKRFLIDNKLLTNDMDETLISQINQEVDSATGLKVVNVSVVSAKMMHKREGKKFWKSVATVAGNQRKGKGTTYDQAINNAIRLCAQSVAKQMVQKLNAKGIK